MGELPPRIANAILEIAELTDHLPSADALGVNAIKDAHIIANGEEPKTIIIITIMVLHQTLTIIITAPLTTTITMVHLTRPLTIITTIIITALRAVVPRAEVLR